MGKCLISLLLALLTLPLYSQIVLRSEIGVIEFDTLKLIPVRAFYTLSERNRVVITSRVGTFRIDPRLPSRFRVDPKEYRKSGYDKGHMIPAGDYRYSRYVMKETFYMTNIAPQTPSLNRGDWKLIESTLRKEMWSYDSIQIVIEAVGESGRLGRICIPEYYIKKVKGYKKGRPVYQNQWKFKNR